MEGQDDTRLLEQDVARVMGESVQFIRRAGVLYCAEVDDQFAVLLLALYWLHGEGRLTHPIYQRFQYYLERVGE